MAGSDTDSDWDSTLDFTSPRQGRQVPSHSQLPRIEFEIEEEGDPSVMEDAPNQKMKNRVPSSSSFNQLEINGQADVSQGDERSSHQNKQKKVSRQAEARDDIAPRTPRKQQKQFDGYDQPPPYNFKGVPTDPDPSERQKEGQRPGKAKKGTTYDAGASLAPRPVKTTESFQSTGSWDDSDAEDRTLREVRETFSKQKQIEKSKEADKKKNPPNPSGGSDTPRMSRADNSNRSQSSLARMFAANPKRGNDQSQPQSQSRNVQVSREESRSGEPFIPPVYRSVDTDADVLELIELQNIDRIPKPLSELIVRNEEERRYMYHFGHGNFKVLEAGDDDIQAVMPAVADKAERVMRRIFREIFAVLRILTGIIIWFIVELLQYIIQHVIQPLFIGVLMVTADYLIKPTLTIFFSGVVQPTNIFMWNVLVGLRHVCRPVIDITASFAEILAMVLRAFRLFEITRVVADKDNKNQLCVQNV